MHRLKIRSGNKMPVRRLKVRATKWLRDGCKAHVLRVAT
jgi:hypothetical protein